MAGRISVRITKNRLPEIARLLPEAADAIVNVRRGPEMVEVARRHSRVDTGTMRDGGEVDGVTYQGWHWERTGQGEGRLINDVPWTIWNEYGHHDVPPQPMARPAKEEVFPKIEDDFRRLERLLQ